MQHFSMQLFLPGYTVEQSRSGWFCFWPLLLILTGSILDNWFFCSGVWLDPLFQQNLQSLVVHVTKAICLNENMFFYCWLCIYQSSVSIKVGNTSNWCEFLTFVEQWLKCGGGVGRDSLKLKLWGIDRHVVLMTVAWVCLFHPSLCTYMGIPIGSKLMILCAWHYNW